MLILMEVFGAWLTFTIVLISVVIAFLCKTWQDFPVPGDGLQYYLENRLSGGRRPLLPKNFGDFEVNSDAPLFIIIHGYTESSIRPWIGQMSAALLTSEPDSSVLILDYWNYLSLRRLHMMENIQKTAQEFVQFLEEFCSEKKISYSKIHVLAFSLGGRVAGAFSNYLKEDNKIGRITGIDASYPWTGSSDLRDILDSSDAELVVAIRASRVALPTPPVHIDFFINGRRETQPGCCAWWKLDFLCQLCSHYRAIDLVIENILRKQDFLSCPCNEDLSVKESCNKEDQNTFGLATKPQLRGSFCPVTNLAAPLLSSH